MLLEKDGVQTIRCWIDDAAVLPYSADHEPRARKRYGTLGCRTYSRHVTEPLCSMMFKSAGF